MKYFYIINISVLLHTSSSSSLRIIRITLYLTVQAPAIGLRLLYWTESYRGSTIIREIARVSPFSGTVKICTYVALVQARKEETRRGTLYNLIQNSGEKPPVLREEGQLRMTVRAEATYGILFQSQPQVEQPKRVQHSVQFEIHRTSTLVPRVVQWKHRIIIVRRSRV